MLNSRFGYSMKKNSFKGLNIDCIQYSNIIRITYYSYSYSGTILNPNIICIRIRPNICARMLFVFVFAHSEKTNIIAKNIFVYESGWQELCKGTKGLFRKGWIWTKILSTNIRYFAVILRFVAIYVFHHRQVI